MGKIDSLMLDANDVFPELEMSAISGETIKLPEAIGDGYGVVLLYRGYW